MGGRRKRRVRSTGVSMELDILRYLDRFAERQNKDRSFIINQIVREHAERQGVALEPEEIGGGVQV